MKKFSVKQIATQAGVSKATVDRVLHGRNHVHHQTQKRVQQAIKELEIQEAYSLAVGQTFHFDVIMHAPKRFSLAVQEAINSQIGNLGPFRIHMRFHLFEEISLTEIQSLMQQAMCNGSQGVILKAANEPIIQQTINQLSENRIPVITLVTDVPQSQRIAYVGIDNVMAGRTAAYLSHLALRSQSLVGVVLSSERFQGEEERELGFRMWIKERAPAITSLTISGGFGIYDHTLALIKDTLKAQPNLNAIYSVGGGNRAIVEAFQQLNRPLDLFIGHDLDRENRQLLAEEKINMVLSHDLAIDAYHTLLHLLQFHRQKPKTFLPPSQVQVITPFNLR